ncbi:MAG: hypothetical protein ACREPM_02235 [Gemmatimonadaceae bacterium]
MTTHVSPTTWLVAHDAVRWTAVYVIVACLASFAVYAAMPDTSMGNLS